MNRHREVFMLEDRVRAALSAAAQTLPAGIRDPAEAAIAGAHHTVARRRTGFALVVAFSLLIVGTVLLPGSGHPRGVSAPPARYASQPAGARGRETAPSPRNSAPPRSPAVSRPSSRPGYLSTVGTAWDGVPRERRISATGVKRDVLRLDSAQPSGPLTGTAGAAGPCARWPV